MADGDKPEVDQDPAKPDKDETDWKARYEAEKEAAKKWEKRAKENHDKAKRFDELEESQKSELQKLADAQQTAEARADKAERHLMRLQVALDKGLTAVQAKRLVGDTPEELAADADEILESFRPSGDKQETTDQLRGPKETLRSGARPNDEPEPDMREVVAKVPRRI